MWNLKIGWIQLILCINRLEILSLTQRSNLRLKGSFKLKGKSGFMKRLFDFTTASVLLIIFGIPMLFIALLVKLTSKGPVLYWSDRVGRSNSIFKMPKFRTMRTGTPSVATHLMTNPDQYLTPIGKFLRRSSLDEFPQLISILRGDMSFVGPRPLCSIRMILLL